MQPIPRPPTREPHIPNWNDDIGLALGQGCTFVVVITALAILLVCALDIAAVVQGHWPF